MTDDELKALEPAEVKLYRFPQIGSSNPAKDHRFKIKLAGVLQGLPPEKEHGTPIEWTDADEMALIDQQHHPVSPPIHIRKEGDYEMVFVGHDGKRSHEIVTDSSLVEAMSKARDHAEIDPGIESYWVSRVIYNSKHSKWGPKNVRN